MTAAPARLESRRRWVTSDRTAAGDRRVPERSSGIPSLDGIRAIAVTLVLLSHGGIPGVTGGFIGVDIFFVLSGFLITSLLIDELDRNGRVELTGFWIRRARRLLPALLVMVLAVAFARSVFPPDAVDGLRDDAVAAFMWVANWAFVAHKTDYFSQGDAPSPLQHTWSLGVEEQFYLIWPVLLVGIALLIAAILKRYGSSATVSQVRITIGVLAVLGAAASSAEAILLSDDSALNRVYFGTDTRAQALLIGAAASAFLVKDWPALMAGWPVIRSRWAHWLGRAASLAGLAGLAVVVHTATGTSDEFRHGLLTLTALAAVAVIVQAALDQESATARVLSFPPLVWLGAISYGVYLWHWPIFLVLNGERTGWSGYQLFAARCAATLALAIASWWLIEQPIRRWRPVHVPVLRMAGATVATAAAVTMVVVPVKGTGPTTPPDLSAATIISPVETVRPAPRLHNGPREHTVSVFGDSIAWTMMRYLPPTPGISFLDRSTIGCGVARGGPYRYQGQTLEQKPECDAWPERWAQRIAYDKPDVVLLIVGRWEVVDRKFQGRWGHIGEPDFDKALKTELGRALDILGSTGARIVVTTEPFNRRGERADGSLYPEDQPSRVKQWNTLLRSVVGDRPNVDILDLNKKLGPWGAYTNKIDGVRMRIDGVHPTPEAVKWMTPWLLDAVE